MKVKLVPVHNNKYVSQYATERTKNAQSKFKKKTCGSFNNATNSSDYTALNDRIINENNRKTQAFFTVSVTTSSSLLLLSLVTGFLSSLVLLLLSQW
jgi:hypothetical protein